MRIAGALLTAASIAACTGEIEEHVASPPATSAPATTAVRFDTDIQKDLDAQSCTQSTCHGSATGGLQLTQAAVGDALAANFEAFKARASGGEAAPVLVKATGGGSHGGGVRFMKTDPVYARWLAWIEQGSPR